MGEAGAWAIEKTVVAAKVKRRESAERIDSLRELEGDNGTGQGAASARGLRGERVEGGASHFLDRPGGAVCAGRLWRHRMKGRERERGEGCLLSGWPGLCSSRSCHAILYCWFRSMARSWSSFRISVSTRDSLDFLIGEGSVFQVLSRQPEPL